MELEPDFSEFCSLLNAHRVEFVIVGAYALAFHGAPRYTGDIDFLVRPTEENGKRVLDAIAAFGFPTTPVTPQDIVIGRKVIQMGVPPVQIPSVDTSNPAIDRRFKTGHFRRPTETHAVLLRELLSAQVGMDFRAPAPWPTFEHMCVM